MESIIKVFGIDWRLLAIQAFNFTIVLIVLYFFLYKPVLAMLEERKKKIEEGIADAEAAKHALANASIEAGELKGVAIKEADRIISDSRLIAENKEKSLIAEANLKSAKAIADTQKEVEALKKRALDESANEIARLGVLAAEKILRSKES